MLKFLSKNWIGIAFMSIMFMWLMPFGTFNLTQVGFYLCIILAVSLEFSIKFFLKKYQKDYMGKIK
jgi:hypothetical protein